MVNLFLLFIYSVCFADLHGCLASSVICQFWWRVEGRLADWVNECKFTTQPPRVTRHNPIAVHSKHINKCGMSFTVAVKPLIFIKKVRNGHLTGTWCTWLFFDSDDKHTWQLNYILNSPFLFYFGDGDPLCVCPSRWNAMESCIYICTCAISLSFPTLVSQLMLRSSTGINNVYNKWQTRACFTEGRLMRK